MFLGFAAQIGTVDAIDEHVDDAHIAEIPTRCRGRCRGNLREESRLLLCIVIGPVGNIGLREPVCAIPMIAITGEIGGVFVVNGGANI